MTDEEIVNTVAKFKEFMGPNSGGVTISGGEPLIQPKFVAAVFRRAHELGVTTCLDTACYGSEAVWESVLQHTDYVMLCLKGMDNEVAAQVARHDAKWMSRSKDFARYIRDNHRDVKLSLRWVLLKNMTDTDDELNKLVEFAKELSPVFTHVELIPYHQLGRSKYEDLDMPYPLEDMESYDRDEAVVVQRRLEAHEIKVTLAMV